MNNPDFLMFGFIFWFLIFMGIAGIINKLLKRRVVNGALLFLVVGALIILAAIRSHAGAEALGNIVGYLAIPLVIAFFYARKFRKLRMSEHEQSTGASNEGRIWIVALIIVCLGIVGFRIVYSPSTISDRALLAVWYSVDALLLWGMFRDVFLRKRGTRINGIAFFSIYAVLFAGGVISVSQQKQQALQELSSLKEEVSRIEALLDSSELPTKIGLFRLLCG